MPARKDNNKGNTGKPHNKPKPKAKKPCPNLRRSDHDSSCSLCGGTGEVSAS